MSERSEQARQVVSDAIARMAPSRAADLRARLEAPAPPLNGYTHGQGGFVVESTIFIGAAGGSPIVLTKAAYLSEDGDRWRYGFFDPDDCFDINKIPRGEPFMVSKRSWSGPRDPLLPGTSD